MAVGGGGGRIHSVVTPNMCYVNLGCDKIGAISVEFQNVVNFPTFDGFPTFDHFPTLRSFTVKHEQTIQLPIN